MRTIVDVCIGKPSRAPSGGGIMIPVGMHISDDDSDDDEIPEIEYTSIAICITDETLNLGLEKIVEAMDEILFEHRDDFGSISFHKMRGELMTFVGKTDLKALAEPWIDDPESMTRH